MENYGRSGYCKFFRGLIASRQPQEILDIVERYNKDAKKTESDYLDIVLHSNGAVSYQDVMTMPIDSVMLLVERMNHMAEERNNAIKQK